MNILIVAHHFPPENAMASLRPYSWAKYWSALGHDVCVVTTQKESFDDPQTLLLHRDDFQTIEIPYLPKKKDNGQSETDKLKAPTSQPTDNWVMQNIKLRSRRAREFLGLGALLSIRSLWIMPAVKKISELHREKPFDFMVSTYGPPASHIVASIVKRNFDDLHWVADYRDLWNDDNLETRRWPFSAIEKRIEDVSVSRANLLSTVSEPLCEILRARLNKPVICVENGFDVSDLSARQDDFFPEDGKVRLVYTGKVHSGKRDPSPLLAAIQSLLEVGYVTAENLEVLFYSNDPGNLPELIHQFSVDSIVKLPGFVDRNTSLSIQCSADALIFLDWSDPSIDGILTGKIFEYMYAGRPILGIGSDETRSAGRLIHASGTGFCLGTSSDKIAQLIFTLVQGESLTYEPQSSVLNEFTRKGLSGKMLHNIQMHLSMSH
ncbi:MAG: hypothetical protein AAFN38_25865 [Cyanobacteria bacterium J06560_5]